MRRGFNKISNRDCNTELTVLVFILMIFYEGAKLLRAFLQRGQITEGLFTEGPKN